MYHFLPVHNSWLKTLSSAFASCLDVQAIAGDIFFIWDRGNLEVAETEIIAAVSSFFSH